MDQSARQYIAIDLKSFYASVECVERGLDPLDTNLVVADATLYDRIVRKDMLVRRITITAADITDESLKSNACDKAIQLELFSPTDIEAGIMHQKRERLLQEAMLKIKKAYGKNSILKGLNFAEGATQRLRNHQIGGHHE